MKKKIVCSILLALTAAAIYFVYSFIYASDERKVYLTIIDDDTRAETYKYWGRLSKETGVKITIAAVPNWINGNHPSGKDSMTISQLKEMYDDGNDIVSHGFNTLTVQEHLDTPDVIYEELHDSRQWLIDNGFVRNRGYDYFVWPQGLIGDEKIKSQAKKEVGKYYKFAVNAFTVKNHLVSKDFDAYDIPRATSDGQGKLKLIKWMHDTIKDGGWLILLSHSWHAEDYDNGSYDKWSARYRYLLWYAKLNNVQIVTLPVGMKLWCQDNATNEQCQWLNVQSENL